jgi:membrane dipeptidase
MSETLPQARALLRDTPAIDALGGAIVHPTPHVDSGTYEEQLLAQGWGAMHACLVSEPSYNATFEEVLTAINENLLYFEMSPKVKHVERIEDFEAARREGRLGVFFGLQSASCLEQDRKRVRILHKLGLRVLQLTYMERNFLGDGCLEPENRGLTHFGIQVVRDCARVGILVDCSHVGERTTLDAARYSPNPIVVSHTAVRAIADNPRCVTDEQMKAVADKGGAIGITPYAPYIRSDRTPTLADFVDHVEYAVKLIGEDHVMIATDMFDGKTPANWATPWYYQEIIGNAGYSTRRVPGFNRKEHLAGVVAAFLERGLGEAAIRKIVAGNFLRVAGQAWKGGVIAK